MSLQHLAHEPFIAPIIAAFFAMSGLRERRAADAAERGTRADLDLPAHAVAAGRLQLPASADMLGLWRRSD